MRAARVVFQFAILLNVLFGLPLYATTHALPHMPLAGIDVDQYDLAIYVDKLDQTQLVANLVVEATVARSVNELLLNVDSESLHVKSVRKLVGGGCSGVKIFRRLKLQSASGVSDPSSGICRSQTLNWKVQKSPKTPVSDASGDILKIALEGAASVETKIQVSIDYQIDVRMDRFRRGLFFQRRYFGQPIMISRSWPYFARRFLPSHDHPSDIAKFKTTFVMDRDLAKKGVIPFANGERQMSVEQSFGNKRFVVTEFIPSGEFTTYGYQLAVGRLEKEEQTFCWDPKSSLSLRIIRTCRESETGFKNVVVGPYKSSRSDPTTYESSLWQAARKAPEPFSFFSDLFKPYRFGRTFAVLLGPHPFNMESVGAVVLVSPEAMVHEVIHQWWGNGVRIAHWGDLWISEGFTVFLTGLYDKIVYGKYDACSTTSGRLRHPESADPLKIFTGVPYCKGAAAIRDLQVSIAKMMGWHATGTASTRFILFLVKSIYIDREGGTLSTEGLVNLLSQNLRSWLDEFQAGNLNLPAAEVVESLIREWSEQWLS